jgi:hypothetical protein
MQPSGDVCAARGVDQALDVEEEIFAGAVEGHAADLVLRHAVERRPEGVHVRGRDDALRREHHEMRVVELHQRRQKEVFASSKYSPSTYATYAGAKRRGRSITSGR